MENKASIGSTHHRAEWMVQGSFGMMVHWLTPGTYPRQGEQITDFNTAVDAFDLEGLLNQFRASGADWLIFTIGQNTGYYASPNSLLEELAGSGHTSQRDLVLEVAKGVKSQGKRFVAYLPSEVKAQSEEIHRAFAWNPKDQSEFQTRYTAFVREYSERYGSLLDGWWFDGCYTWEDFHNSQYRWSDWCDAARAGNPQAAVAFNDGCFCVGIKQPLTPLQDYLSGEVETLIEGMIRLGRSEDSTLYLPKTRFVEGTQCQWHALVPIDCFWMHSQPGEMEPLLYTDEDLFAFVLRCRAVGGAVTLNVGIYQEGLIGEDALLQLQRLRSCLTA